MYDNRVENDPLGESQDEVSNNGDDPSMDYNDNEDNNVMREANDKNSESRSNIEDTTRDITTFNDRADESKECDSSEDEKVFTN